MAFKGSFQLQRCYNPMNFLIYLTVSTVISGQTKHVLRAQASTLQQMNLYSCSTPELSVRGQSQQPWALTTRELPSSPVPTPLWIQGRTAGGQQDAQGPDLLCTHSREAP